MPVTPVNDAYSTASGGVIAGGRVHVPAWRRAMPARTWAEVGINTLSAIDPAINPAINPNHPGAAPWAGMNGHPSVISAWCGGAWDESARRLYITGGGHGDYAGNEAYAWDATTGAFSRLSTPTGAVGNTGVLNDGLDATNPSYFDGQPRSAHTYGHLQIVNGEFWNFQGSTYSIGFGVRSAYKLVGDSWVRQTSRTFGASYGMTVWDSSRQRFLLVSNNNGRPVWWKPSNDTVGQMTYWTNNDAQEAYGVYDSRRDIVLQFSKYVTVFRCDDTADAVQITETGTAPSWATYTPIGSPSRTGLVYDYDNDRYLVWGNGSSIYILTPPPVGSNPLTATWEWSRIDPSAENTVTPTSAASNGTYGRFWHSPFLNCCGVVNSTTQKMYVFRLS